MYASFQSMMSLPRKITHPGTRYFQYKQIWDETERQEWKANREIRQQLKAKSDGPMGPCQSSGTGRPVMGHQPLKKTHPAARYLQYKQIWDETERREKKAKRSVRQEVKAKIDIVVGLKSWQPPGTRRVLQPLMSQQPPKKTNPADSVSSCQRERSSCQGTPTETRGGLNAEGRDEKRSKKRGDEGGSNAEGRDEEGSKKRGDEEGSNAEESIEEGSNTDGSDKEGSNTEGSDEEGSNTEGRYEEWLNTEGSYEEGSNTVGSDEEWSTTEGSYEEGSNTEGSYEEWLNTEGSYEEGSNTVGSDEEWSNTEGSYEEGSNTVGSDEEWLNEEESVEEGSNAEGWYEQGMNERGDEEGSNTEGGDEDGWN